MSLIDEMAQVMISLERFLGFRLDIIVFCGLFLFGSTLLAVSYKFSELKEAEANLEEPSTSYASDSDYSESSEELLD